MNKKKILVFIDWFLPGYRAGGPIQSCANLIEHLKEEFDFSVVTRDTDYMDDTPYVNVKSNEWNILPNGMRVYYFSKEKLSAKNIQAILLKEQFDVIYLNGIYSLYFTLYPLYYLRKTADKQIIIAARGMFAESALEIKKIKKQIFLSIARITNFFHNVVFHATNQQEEDDIKIKIANKIKIKIAPNLWQKDIYSEWKQRNKKTGNARLVDIARIAPEKNTDFAISVLLRIKGDIEFDLYGPVYDQDYWNACKQIIKNTPSNVQVNYKGSLQSEKVLETLSEYHFLFHPTKGENFGHVILQAMNVGIPVIISDQTMWRNLNNNNSGWDISLSSEKDFVSLIEKCAAMNQEEYDIFSKGAFEFAKEFINDKDKIEQSRQLFLKS